MSGYRLQDVIRTNRLRESYGEEIALTEDGKDTAAVYRLVLEFDVGGRSYAVLQPGDERSEDAGEYLLFRINGSGAGQYEIETIDDDEEWEDVSELVDEMTTRFSDDT
ncbi:DUF1292 domain-containing protein [Paenibacillus alkalitolerans]|uniref:DUF1292 domain-containing protein n=1 Tax=Paenibacillus alkalitolerans TaxID=2799335 RepID=UPI0018F59DAC|nr:DUF1292 domain-containing protein [Paenibacillus alkalitolerans]